MPVEEVAEEITPDEDEELGPGLDQAEVSNRLNHSRIVGDYYRDLSLNYSQYEASGLWPEHPFPNEKYKYSDIA